MCARAPKLTAADRARAAWLWSGRRATLVGHSAAAALGDKWISADAPVEISHSRRPAAKGIKVYSDGLRADEVCSVDDMCCTTAARTAYDLGRRLPLVEAVIRIDALLNATRVPAAAVASIASRYPGARGIAALRSALDLVDGGAESPQETRLRLVFIRAGLPRPVTQIPVRNDRGRVVRRIDMGWPQWMVGVEYDGEQHFSSPDDYGKDITRLEFLADQGWTIVRVSGRQLRNERRAVVTPSAQGTHRGRYALTACAECTIVRRLTRAMSEQPCSRRGFRLPETQRQLASCRSVRRPVAELLERAGDGTSRPIAAERRRAWLPRAATRKHLRLGGHQQPQVGKAPPRRRRDGAAWASSVRSTFSASSAGVSGFGVSCWTGESVGSVGELRQELRLRRLGGLGSVGRRDRLVRRLLTELARRGLPAAEEVRHSLLGRAGQGRRRADDLVRRRDQRELRRLLGVGIACGRCSPRR